MNKNELAFKTLIGNGVEFGALHNPVLVDPDKASVKYADRLPKNVAIKAFPELEDVRDDIVDSDYIVDLDNDSLSLISGNDFDFVIANHVIEHLVNPMWFLKKVADNLKTDGKFFLTVPNMEYTHDSNRKLTRFKTLQVKYKLRVKRLSNSRIRDYLKHKHPVENIHPETIKFFEKNGLPLSYYNGNKIPLNPILRKRLFDYHRSRSIHVHVWNRVSFDFFLRRTIDLLNLKLKITNYLPKEASEGEMIYLLTKK